MKNVDEREVLRYLGCGGKPVEDTLRKSVAACLEMLQAVCTPKSVERVLPVTLGKDSVQLGSLHFSSADLCRHLRGCRQGVLFAATLGVQADRLLERMSKLDMSRAAILQAAAAAMTESYCDEQESRLAAKAEQQGLFLRPRYSPGYGDFPVTSQGDILRLLDCPRRIGLTMTESCMLVPIKSVTAVIGLTTEKADCTISKCMGCAAKECPFRREV